MGYEMATESAPTYQLSHIGYVVDDIHKALKRFLKAGAQLLLPPTQETQQRVWVCLIEMEGGVKLELVAPIDVSNHPLQARLSRGGGLDHLCFEVNDLQAAVAYEREHGAELLCQPTKAVAFKGYELAFVSRRSGLVVELLCQLKEKE